MKINQKFNESKEKEDLPITFLTSFVSKGWDEVGILRADSEAIKETYKGAFKIEKIINDLIDSYLIAIGQIEAHLEKKDYLDYSRDDLLKESVKEDINIDNLKIDEIDINSEKEILPEPETPLIKKIEVNEPSSVDPANEKAKMPVAPNMDDIEYFVDFGEPVGEKITDADLYDDQK